MAISHAQPLVLLLFVSLFFLPALGKNVRFGYCSGGSLYPVTVLTVDISPQPIIGTQSSANITISGFTILGISRSAQVTANLVVSGNVIPPLPPKTYSLCDLTDCPVNLGFIELTFTNFFTKDDLLWANGRGVFVRIEITDTADFVKDKLCMYFECETRW
ncbi:hypothetical protein AALP_AA3G158300 [Arabis alpina]|uniref:MD-2-related lipid-recognition domain-containing protein n=1 Tax=Arabis alpina TaxID=50452 RepID=A0A087H9G9_ARAAL|nr:hypothetical protein AALP_AA3G158300 [Arabis alpina]